MTENTSQFHLLNNSVKESLVFIDSQVPQYQHLVQGAIPEAKVIVLDSGKDGVAQITQVLAQYSNLTSVHIVSHGSPGCLYLGNTQLSLDTLHSYRRELQTWFTKSPIPQLLLYGCNVAAGDAGEEFISKLNVLTGAEIAASASPTGNKSLGGDWELEVSTGNASVSLAFSEDARLSYGGVLIKPPTVKPGVAKPNSLKFTLLGRNSKTVNEVAFFDPVDIPAGITVDPKSQAYIEAALQVSKVIFSAPNTAKNKSTQGNTNFFAKTERTIEGQFPAVQNFNLLLVKDGSVDFALEAIHSGGTIPTILFDSDNSAAKREDLKDAAGNVISNIVQWNTNEYQGDTEYDNLTLGIELPPSEAPVGNGMQGTEEIIDLSKYKNRTVRLRFTITSESAFDNRVGLYMIDDTNGKVTNASDSNTFDPFGNPSMNKKGYADAAKTKSLVEFDEDGTVAKAKLPGNVTSIIDNGAPVIEFLVTQDNQYLAPYLIAGDTQTNTLFTFEEANPGSGDYTRLWGDNTFGFEDWVGAGGDNDFNDFVFQVNVDIVS